MNEFSKLMAKLKYPFLKIFLVKEKVGTYFFNRLSNTLPAAMPLDSFHATGLFLYPMKT